MVTFRPKLLLLAMSGSRVLLQLGSVLMSNACVSTGTHTNDVLNQLLNYVLNHVLKYKAHAEPVLPLTGLGRAAPLTMELTLCQPWDSGPYDLSMGELAPPLT